MKIKRGKNFKIDIKGGREKVRAKKERKRESKSKKERKGGKEEERKIGR